MPAHRLIDRWEAGTIFYGGKVIEGGQWSSSPMRTLIEISFILPFLIASAFAEKVLTRVGDIISLPSIEAAQNRPVRISAILLYNDPSRSTFFVNDGTASCYVQIPLELRESLETGHKYVFEGETAPGAFLPIFAATSVKHMGAAVEPEPIVLEGDEVISPSVDAQWVEVEGRVNAAMSFEDGAAIELAVQGRIFYGLLPRQLPADIVPPRHLLERQIKLRGIAAGNYNAAGQMSNRFFYVPSVRHLIPVGVTQPLPEPMVKDATGLITRDSSNGDLVLVKGTLTHHIPGDSYFIRDHTGTVRVRTSVPLDIAPGDIVEAIGIAAMEPVRPVLRATSLRKTGTGTVPVPTPFDVRGVRETSEHLELVSTVARLLTIREALEGFTLQCQARGTVFEAFLDRRLADGISAKLTPGCTLRLTGLCQLLPSRFFYMQAGIDGFRLQLRGTEDISILSSPPWWTTARMVGAMGALTVLVGLAFLWGFTLRHRVAVQTVVISKKIARATVLEERQRIARELHDTLEQELAGVGMQIDNASRHLSDRPEETRRALQIAGRMLRHSREESRSTIVELRSFALEHRGLAGAIEELLQPLVMGSGIGFQLRIRGEARPLATVQGNHLLRIAQEAVSNAARHSSARNISVTLGYSATGVLLEVADDGCGFSPETGDDLPGHFGLLGMHERATKLHTQLTIRSEHGAGTTVRIAVPLENVTPSP